MRFRSQEPADKLQDDQANEITHVFGLKVGDILPYELLDKWCGKGPHWIHDTNGNEGAGEWKCFEASFVTDRMIESLKEFDGVWGVELSKT